MVVDIAHLRKWVGRTEEAAETIAPEPLVGLMATLNRDDPAPEPGDPVPPGGHWLYFLPRHLQTELDVDGHAARGGFLPPVDLPRRMWAGGNIEFRECLRVGEQAKRVSTVADVVHKQGKSGELVFILVRHEIFGSEGPTIIEEHDIVYRAEVNTDAPSPAPKPVRSEAQWIRTISPDPVLLFRYSALIFNAHRIHYDYKFATEDEGYPGLIVHGPLIATMMMDLCRREQPELVLRRFDYRAVSPLFDNAPFTVNGRPSDNGRAAELWAASADGRLAMTADAEFEI